MFVYEKKLQYPVKIKNTNPKLAALIISQYGGPYPHKLRKQMRGHPASHLLLSSLPIQPPDVRQHLRYCETAPGRMTSDRPTIQPPDVRQHL